ncbi:pilus assembly protein [Actinobacteria bacterium YIM 96077]|uniref:Pilus assembly protein n=1 Tax=Phytoactinopolyspora halophila TaxID=1981511 RepID=A0A329R2R8_9ACTN|nr:TadE/TadG family type IV pilus assembly protein [Phytoactinopolyspora halophila]AYY15248.1 pilus assembly protein [Actinobacteria bacterium YIM 96077]RAW18955.1 pilus assembly protein [Phytoactinopolyspora halophila]
MAAVRTTGRHGNESGRSGATRPTSDGALRHDRGAAVVEFTLVSALLTMLFLGILQLGFAIHVRNTVVASAAEGARYAANANRSLADGQARTQMLLAESLSSQLSTDVGARIVDVGGAATVEVTVTTTLPLVGMLGIEQGMTVTGHAMAEPAP